MPLPSPNPKETEQEFIKRCMSDEVMKREYPKQNQRLAVCYNIYNRHKKEKNAKQK